MRTTVTGSGPYAAPWHGGRGDVTGPRCRGGGRWGAAQNRKAIAKGARAEYEEQKKRRDVAAARDSLLETRAQVCGATAAARRLPSPLPAAEWRRWQRITVFICAQCIRFFQSPGMGGGG